MATLSSPFGLHDCHMVSSALSRGPVFLPKLSADLLFPGGLSDFPSTVEESGPQSIKTGSFIFCKSLSTCFLCRAFSKSPKVKLNSPFYSGWPQCFRDRKWHFSRRWNFPTLLAVTYRDECHPCARSVSKHRNNPQMFLD